MEKGHLSPRRTWSASTIALVLAFVIVAGTALEAAASPRASVTGNAIVPSALRYESADVIVVGAGTSGIAAALSARKYGAKRVFLMDANDYIGGQVAAGVGTMDEGGYDKYDQRADGMWGTIVARFLAEYAKRGWPHASTCYGAGAAGRTVCIAPSVARKVYGQMLREAGVEVRLGVRVTPVVSGGRMLGVSWRNVTGTVAAGRVSSKVVIDATEYGDVLAQTGAPYRSGNGLGNTAGTAPAGHVQPITNAAIVKKYAPGAMPAALNLVGKPFPVAPGDPAPATTKARVLTYFASKVAIGGSTYNNTTKSAWSPLWHLQYRGLPNPPQAPYLAKQTWRITRTALNWANDYPRAAAGDLGGKALSVRYLEDAGYRWRINCRAKLRTIQFVWYMQNKLGQSAWTVANDEGFNTPYNRANRCAGTEVSTRYAAFEAAMPTLPYVRESRRGIGVTTVTAAQVLRLPTGELAEGPYGLTSLLAAQNQPLDTIAVGYYSRDLHGAYSPADMESELESASDYQDVVNGLRPIGPFGIPMSALVSTDVSGLIFAEKNSSASRYASSAMRLQSETTLIGAAAGALAARSVRWNRAPVDVPARAVQFDLSRKGTFLAVNHFLDVPRWAGSTVAFELSALYNADPGETHVSARPSVVVTRAEAASWVRRSTELGDGDASTSVLADVDAGSAYASDVWALEAAGVPVACADTTFCPDAPVSRSDFMVWLAYALDAAHGTHFASAPDPTSGRFVDVSPGAASQAIHSVSRHLTSVHGVSFGASFRPTDPVKRQYAAHWTAWELVDPAWHTEK